MRLAAFINGERTRPGALRRAPTSTALTPSVHQTALLLRRASGMVAQIEMLYLHPGLRHKGASHVGTDSSKLLDSILDDELLARVVRHDAEAFTLFYSRTSDTLYSVALSILREPQLAEDVLQDVYLQIWKNAEAYDPALGKPIAWMISLTRNKALDRLRSSKRRDLALQALAENPTAPKQATQPSTPAEESTEASQWVKQRLNAFPIRQRKALELALFQGMTHAEIAKALNEPLGTVKAWLRRGLLELRDGARRFL